jgi:cytochrome c oxidase assembly protein subunit 15
LAERDLHRLFRRLALGGVLLTAVVIVLGAYTRLSDSGLGCPDWPGCYGHLAWPDEAAEIARANEAFPERPVEIGKAWREMVHRYAAAILGLLIIALAVIALRNRRDPAQPVVLPVFLVALVIFQGILGMWTVTWQLKPLVVMGHLLGGFSTLAVLWWLAIGAKRWETGPAGPPPRIVPLSILAIGVLTAQIALGGWTSSNYAALACPDFPTCQGVWWPPMNFGEGFDPWHGIGRNFEFGILEHPARTAIHMSHRIGAIVTTLLVGGFALWLALRARGAYAAMAWGVLAVLTLQVLLGISNIVFHLPLAVAVAHNAVAAVLLLSLLTLIAAATAERRLHGRI